MALFSTTLDERREAFVRARFAEQQVFDFGDIEEWLKSQREAERPDTPRWAKLLEGKSWSKEPIASQCFLLTTCATPISVLGRETITQSPLINILSLFQPGLYWGMHEGIYIGSSDKPETNDVFFAIREVDDRLIITRVGVPFDRRPSLDSELLMWVLLAEWNHKRPKSRDAQSILCCLLFNKIKTTRMEAERDFHNAVATSEDGTKIVHADWVVVIDGNNALLYPENVFQLDGKAKLGIESGFRQCAPLFKNTQELVLEFLKSHATINAKTFFMEGMQYQIIKYGSQADPHKLLFIEKGFCPNPLPSGGIEVT
jgi:hypothetical protein